MKDRDVINYNQGTTIPDKLTTRSFIYNLLTEQQEDVTKTYDSIRVTGLGGGNNLVIELWNKGKLVKQTKPAALERFELPEEGRSGSIKHAIFQLLHRRGRTIDVRYDSVVFVDPGKNRKSFTAHLMRDGKKVGEFTLEDTPDADRSVTRTAVDVDYAQDPWAEGDIEPSEGDKVE